MGSHFRTVRETSTSCTFSNPLGGMKQNTLKSIKVGITLLHLSYYDGSLITIPVNKISDKLDISKDTIWCKHFTIKYKKAK